MWMGVARVHLQPSQLSLAEGPMLQHAGDRVAERIGRMPLRHVLIGSLAETAGIAGVTGVHLVSRLLARNSNSLDIDDDHAIAGVQVRRVGWLVLAAKDLGDVRRQPAQGLAARIDDVPVRLELRWFRAVGFSRCRHQYSTPT